jgi:RNA polymerase-binding transcription factor DksA
MTQRSLVNEFRQRLASARRFLRVVVADRPRGRRDLKELAAAEARLDAGVYGLCESCGRPIALARLRVSPTMRRCSRCATPRGRRS